MNPVFIILVVLLAILLWVLLSFTFKPIGKLFYRLVEDTVKEINDEDDSE